MVLFGTPVVSQGGHVSNSLEGKTDKKEEKAIVGSVHGAFGALLHFFSFLGGQRLRQPYRTNVFWKSFGQNQFPHESFIYFCILVIVKDNLMDLYGS
jgi:hypothetical protein